MNNYWLERAKLRQRTSYRVEVLLKFTGKSLVQIQEANVKVLAASANLLKVFYSTMDAMAFKDILDWRVGIKKQVVEKSIVVVRKYNGLGDVVEAWEIINPSVDFKEFKPSRQELTFRFTKKNKLR